MKELFIYTFIVEPVGLMDVYFMHFDFYHSLCSLSCCCVCPLQSLCLTFNLQLKECMAQRGCMKGSGMMMFALTWSHKVKKIEHVSLSLSNVCKLCQQVSHNNYLGVLLLLRFSIRVTCCKVLCPQMLSSLRCLLMNMNNNVSIVSPWVV